MAKAMFTLEPSRKYGPQPWDNQYTFHVGVVSSNGKDVLFKGSRVGRLLRHGKLALENKSGVYGSEKHPIKPQQVFKTARQFVEAYIELGFPLAATSVRNGEDDNFKGKGEVCPRKSRDPYTSEELADMLAKCESVVMIKETITPAIQFNYKKAAKKSPAKKPAKKAASGTLMG